METRAIGSLDVSVVGIVAARITLQRRLVS